MEINAELLGAIPEAHYKLNRKAVVPTFRMLCPPPVGCGAEFGSVDFALHIDPYTDSQTLIPVFDMAPYWQDDNRDGIWRFTERGKLFLAGRRLEPTRRKPRRDASRPVDFVERGKLPRKLNRETASAFGRNLPAILICPSCGRPCKVTLDDTSIRELLARNGVRVLE